MADEPIDNEIELADDTPTDRPVKQFYRRPSRWTADLRFALKMAAGYGLRIPQLAAIAGVTAKAFEDRLARDKALRRALDEGRAMAELEVSKTLFEKATSGDINAIKWYEQTRTNRNTKTEEVHQHNLNIDFSAAIQKFEALNARRVQAIESAKPQLEASNAEVWVAGGDLAAQARIEEAESRPRSQIENEYDARYKPGKRVKVKQVDIVDQAPQKTEPDILS